MANTNFKLQIKRGVINNDDLDEYVQKIISKCIDFCKKNSTKNDGIIIPIVVI